MEWSEYIKTPCLLVHHELCRKFFGSMAPVEQIINLGPFLLTTLGIFELSVVYCPIRDSFHLTPLGNNPEEISKCNSIILTNLLVYFLCIGTTKLNASVPLSDINEIPWRVYIHKGVVDCVGSGEPTGEGTPRRVYFAINESSERVIAVEVIKLCGSCVHECICQSACTCLLQTSNDYNIRLYR